MRILIAEDDVTSRTMLTAVLQKAGHDVLPTPNGEEALAIMAQENPPQLLILDWLMPKVNGLEVVQQLRTQPSPTPPYIIMLTTKRGKTEAVTALDAGVNDYLSKPFDMEELLARVTVGQRMVQMQSQRQELLDRFERITSQVPGVIFQYLINPTTGHESIPYASPRFEQIFGLSVEAVRQDTSLLQPRFHPDDWPGYRASIAQAMARLDMWSNRYRILHPSGKTYWAEGKAIPQPLPDGSVLWHGYLQDITEQHQAEIALWQSNRELATALQQLEKAQEQLVQQERLAAVGQLSAGIAHQFNNILAVILLNVQMMSQTSKLGAWERQALDTVEERTQTAARLIQQILDFSQHSLMNRTAVDWYTLLQEQRHLLQGTLPENITLTLTAPPQQSFPIYADTHRLQQLLINLVLNARDAMPEGGEVSLTLTQRSLAEPEGGLPAGDWVQLAVADTGEGMDETTQAHMFEPFFTTKQIGQGSGLGLSQVQGIVSQHEGHLTVDTAVGEGTTVTVYLPMAGE